MLNGELLTVFRSDSTSFFWTTKSTDEGRTWELAKPLGGPKPFAWSVKPRLRVLASGIVVLSGGRPGIDLWASADHGFTFTRYNLAAEHNLRVSDNSLKYDAQVVRADGPKAGRAVPEPQTSSYTGLAEAADGALVVSYDRIANGWRGPPGVWGNFDAMFTMRVRLQAHDVDQRTFNSS
jgi:hypothetical protein|eukprot:COSAG02_NODE_16799_length_1054_cov_102.019081_1_plen_179_part_00